MSFIHRSSLVEIVESLRMGTLSLEEYLTQFLDRYEQLEPNIHAFVVQNNLRARITHEANQLMKLYPQPDARPALYGIPVGVKDIIHVSGFRTQAGSNLPSNVLTNSEALIVSTLRSAGALIAGKTITEEFAYSGATPTRNPHNLKHSPGGSSAGSAASVSAGLCPLAIGTQTLLSVIAPASFCGVVGFKPSYGRIPITGTILLSPSFDTIGLFTQDIKSMQLASASIIPQWESPFIEPASLKKPTLGIPNGIYTTMLYKGTWSVFENQLDALKREGYIVRKIDMPWEDSFIYGDSMLRLIQAEMANVHEEWFDKYSHLYSAGLRSAIEKGQKISQAELDPYRLGQILLRDNLEQTMVREGINLWVSPAQAGAAPEGFSESGRSGMTSIWTYAGLPTISIPGAKINGMPLGFQCIGTYGNDEVLLNWAEDIEKVINTGL